MTLHNKTIVVTGCCSGIGADFAKLARQQGARVIGVDRNAPTLTLDGFVQVDLGDPAAINDAVAQLPAKVDALANIAGVPGTSPAELVGRVASLPSAERVDVLLDVLGREVLVRSDASAVRASL